LAKFVDLIDVESLVITIGTSNGGYKFKAEPTLRFNILQEVHKLLTNNMPFFYLLIILLAKDERKRVK